MENSITSIIDFIKTQLDVPSTDPDEQRRSRLLNIFLVGFFVLSILGIVAVLVALPFIGVNGRAEILLGLWTIVAAAVFTTITLIINRYGIG